MKSFIYLFTDLSTDMPHFSQKNLVEKFGHKETLTYWYFLKHGRPSFAFLIFLSKHQHRKYIPKTRYLLLQRSLYLQSKYYIPQPSKRTVNYFFSAVLFSISKATNKAYQLAVTHFANNKIVNSCVAFLELLSVDTSFVRIDIEAARRILHHGDKGSLECTNLEEFKNVIGE